MFYLTTFYKTIFRSIPAALLFITMTVSLIVIAGTKTEIEQTVSGFSKVDIGGSYFNALISSDQNQNRVARKLREVPGVHRVEVISKNILNKEVASLMDSFSLSDSTFIESSFNGLKIIFSANLKESSQELIVEYLKRLVGDNHVTAGPIVQLSKEIKKSTSLLKKISDWSWYVLFTLIVTAWGLSFKKIHTQLQETGYLVEQFQRRKKVAFKSYILGVFSLMVPAVVITAVINMQAFVFAIIAFFAIALMSLTMIQNYRWER